MVHLQRFNEKYAKDGLLVFAISLHPDSSEAQKLTKDIGVSYVVLQGFGSALAEQYGYG